MSNWKKVLMLLMVLMLAVGVSSAFAQSRNSLKTSRPIESTALFTDQDGNTMDYGVWVYGLTIYADAASSYMAVVDCDTTNEIAMSHSADTKYAKDEIGEPTQYEVTTVMYTKPFYYSEGVGARIVTGVGFVHYGPAPTD